MKIESSGGSVHGACRQRLRSATSDVGAQLRRRRDQEMNACSRKTPMSTIKVGKG